MTFLLLGVALYCSGWRVSILFPCTYECDFVGKEDLCTCNQLKMKSYWMRVNPKPVAGVQFLREGCLKSRRNTGNRTKWTQRQEVRLCCQKPKKANDGQWPSEDRRGKRGLFPGMWPFQYPLFEASFLQNIEGIKLCCLKSTVVIFYGSPKTSGYLPSFVPLGLWW